METQGQPRRDGEAPRETVRLINGLILLHYHENLNTAFTNTLGSFRNSNWEIDKITLVPREEAEFHKYLAGWRGPDLWPMMEFIMQGDPDRPPRYLDGIGLSIAGSDPDSG